MAWKLYEYENLRYDNANWLDVHSEISFFLRARLDTLVAVTYQTFLSHRGATNQFMLRKSNAATPQMQFRMISGGVTVTLSDTVWTVATTQVHSWAGRWKKNTATNGMKFWRDAGVTPGTDYFECGTTTQTSDYDSGGNIDLYLGAYSWDNNPMKGSLQDVMLWVDHSLSAQEVAMLHKGYRWFEIGGLTRPCCVYPLSGGLLGRVPDLSGFNRSIEQAWIDHWTLDTSAGEFCLTRPAPRVGWKAKSRHRPVFSVPPPPSPNPWIYWNQTIHPSTTMQVTGLTNGVAYEFCVSALDQSGNESNQCAPVTATPIIPTPVIITHPIPWRIPKRRTKYRSTQQ